MRNLGRIKCNHGKKKLMNIKVIKELNREN